jgi:hypothetical protein
MDAPEQNNPLLEELDEARQCIFAKCDHDPAKVIAWYMEYQKQYADRLISRHQQSPRDKSAA